MSLYFGMALPGQMAASIPNGGSEVLKLQGRENGETVPADDCR